jgi:hypothetical protein
MGVPAESDEGGSFDGRDAPNMLMIHQMTAEIAQMAAHLSKFPLHNGSASAGADECCAYVQPTKKAGDCYDEESDFHLRDYA